MCKLAILFEARRTVSCGFLVVLLVFATDAQSQCPDVPNSPYNGGEITRLVLDVQNRLIVECEAGNMNSCYQAQSSLYYADSYINQMQIRCVDSYANCRRFGLGNLVGMTGGVINLADRLQARIGGYHSFRNTREMLEAWEQIRLCTAAPPPVCAPPERLRNTAKMYYIPPSNPWPDAELCLTDRQAEERMNNGENIRVIPGDCPPICDSGFQRGIYNGVEVCLRCPAGTTYSNNCCS